MPYAFGWVNAVQSLANRHPHFPTINLDLELSEIGRRLFPIEAPRQRCHAGQIYMEE